MLALGGMGFGGMGGGEKAGCGVGIVKCVLRAWGQLKRGFEVLALVKYVLRAWVQLKRGLEVLAFGEMCFEGMGAIEKGVGGVGTV